MGVEAREVEGGGVVLVCNTTGLPLPVSVGTFSSAEEGEWFLAWLERDARTYVRAGELQELAQAWKRLDPPWREPEPGSVCGEYPAVGE